MIIQSIECKRKLFYFIIILTHIYLLNTPGGNFQQGVPGGM